MVETPDSPPAPKRGVDIPVFGILVTAAGIVLLLNTFDVVDWSVWGHVWRLWPALLVLMGLKIVFGRMSAVFTAIIALVAIGTIVGFALAASETDLFKADFSDFTYELPRDGFETLELDIDLGAAKLRVEPLAATDGRLLVAEFFDDESDVRTTAEPSGSTQRVELALDSSTFSFFKSGSSGREWTVRINPEVATTLRISGGGGQFTADLAELRVKSFDIDIGAADLDVIGPAAAGHVAGTIDAGAADIHVVVPEGVAARIDVDSGVSSVNIDSDRFPEDGDVHESPDYASAENRLNLSIDAGASSIRVD